MKFKEELQELPFCCQVFGPPNAGVFPIHHEGKDKFLKLPEHLCKKIIQAAKENPKYKLKITKRERPNLPPDLDIEVISIPNNKKEGEI